MEERITIELPIVRVDASCPMWTAEFAQEHYPKGVFLLRGDIENFMCYHDGRGCVWNVPCPWDIFEGAIVDKTKKDLDAEYYGVLDEFEGKLDRIEKLCNDTNSELYRQREARVKGFKAMSERFDTLEKGEDVIMDLIGDIRKEKSSGDTSGGTNVLDVAKAFAVISKPELIKELNRG